MQNLLQDLRDLLAQDPRLISQDGALLKNLVIELGLKLDVDLLRLLLSHDRIKQHFFTPVDGVLVFDKDKFLRFVNNKEFLPDSYTAFKNKIGLSDDGGETYLSRRREVTLVWPYKDCVLEGGQTQEDAKRDEIFWNTTLAPDDIDRLLDPKVLTGWRRYDAEGEHAVTELCPDDNLIIRGNNLLALHSLVRRFGGKVKLIYIDPPYNT
jgi:adenine-specific DNA-methyltransferase